MYIRYRKSWFTGVLRLWLTCPLKMALCMAIPGVKVFECGQCADHAVFMKPVAPVGAAIIDAIDAVDLVMEFLRCR
jgi:hypothetical protein